jgi:hypothetical protein
MAQYMLSVCHDGPYPAFEDLDFSDPDLQRQAAQVGAFNEELQAAGAWVFGAGLSDKSTATVVRSVGGEISMTDGPFAETKEQVGGFWIIEVPDFDVALDWAGRASAACERPVEVRASDGG